MYVVILVGFCEQTDSISKGKIVPPRTKPGQPVFGWDPIFEYEGKTYAEMEKSEKNQISHRSKALAKLKGWLDTRSQSAGEQPQRPS